MSKKYPGGLIRKTPPTITPPVDGEGGSAPGVWTLEQASYYTKQGTWPKPVLPRALYAWGGNASGQLGQNDTVSRSSPVQVGSLNNWSKISAGQSTPLFVKLDGTLWAVGLNNKGQVGDGTVVNRSSPVQIGALTNWLDVASGGYRGSAIRQDGTIWTWGSNSRGQLGLNITDTAYRSSPVQVGALTTWAKLYAGQGTSFAIKTDGTLWGWGAGSFGMLGDNTTIDRSSPVQVGSDTNWSFVAVADTATFGIKTNGTLWSWGRNNYGQLGLNLSYVGNDKSNPTQIGALTNWSTVSGSSSDTILAVKTDGTLWAWGNNSSGWLGDNTTTNRSSPIQIGSLTNWSKVAAGAASLAIKTDGTLWSWGTGSAQGRNTTVATSSPVQVGALTSWSDVSAWSGVVSAIIKG